MTNPGQYRQLVLHPIHRNATLPVARLTAILADLGLTGEMIHPDWPHRHYIGERFLQYLSFMGCAPSLEFKPVDPINPDWRSFTFISLTATFAASRCFIDSMMAKPCCPKCGKRHATAGQGMLTEQASLVCPKCQQTVGVDQWEWYEFGGCARQFLSIVNVYPKEAIPTDTLLQHLQDKTQLGWRYFYINTDLLDA